jgi:hypothetical protein
MENTQLTKVNTKALDNIGSSYVTDIKDLQAYLPKETNVKIESLSQDIKDEIVKAGRRYVSGIKSSIPMICKNKSCCLQYTCALLKNNLAPTNYPCPYEEFMVDRLTAEYYSSLNVDPFNRVERDLIKQMVELIIIDNRASADLSTQGLYTTQVVGANNKGVPLEMTVESLAYSIKLKTQVRIQKIQNELLATRKVQKQFDVGKKDDPSSKSADLFERYKEFVDKNEIKTKFEVMNESAENIQREPTKGNGEV